MRRHRHRMETLVQTKKTACAEVAYRLRYMFFLPEPPFRPGTPPARWPAGHRTRHRAATRSSCTAVRELQPLGTPPDPSRVAGVPGMAQAGRRGGREAPAGRRQPSRKIQKAGRAFSQSEVSTYLNTYLNSQQNCISSVHLLKYPQVHSQNLKSGCLICFDPGRHRAGSRLCTCTVQTIQRQQRRPKVKPTKSNVFYFWFCFAGRR